MVKDSNNGITDEVANQVKKQFADYETVKQQLADANETIAGFKAMDIDGIRAAADEWKAKYEQAEKDHITKLADLAFEGLLNGAVTAAKGKNAKAIRALLDVETLKASKNQETDVKTALEELKKESGYLFDDEQTPPPYAAGTGTQSFAGKNEPASLADALREKYEMKG